MTDPDPVSAFLTAIESATLPACDQLAPEMTLDATVPNWRFGVHGGEAVRQELARWYAAAGCFEDLVRTPLPSGELVEFTLRWLEDGVAHAVHQAHIVKVAGGRIVSDTVWCGGRWSAALLAEMADAQ